ncbi:MAG: sensor histidine kinase, partial [Oxalobacteraceae bacterium]
ITASRVANEVQPLILKAEPLTEAERATFQREFLKRWVAGGSREKNVVAADGTAKNFDFSDLKKVSWDSLNAAIFAVMIIVAPIILGLAAAGIYVLRLLRRDARRRAELEEANETNVMLFREIHHRVKNNLQSVQSLVRMQDMPRSAKIDLQSRLSAMAAMHEHIYRHDRYEDIDASELIPVVVDEVLHAYGTNTQVDYQLDHVAVDRDHVTPLSLLLSELVTNALKYAFSDGREGMITVRVRDIGNSRCELVVSDNGVGFGPMPDTPTSMGLRLIRGVVSQMGGTYQFVNDNGTRFEANLALSNAGHAAGS